MRTIYIVAILTLTLGTIVSAQPRYVPPSGESTPGGYQVVVNSANHVRQLSPAFLRDAYYKRLTRWPSSGETIRPVDLDRESAVRQRFSLVVLQRSVVAVRAYWQQVIFSGRGVPPPELDDEQLVLRYVKTYRGALGYVSNNTSVVGVRVVEIAE